MFDNLMGNLEEQQAELKIKLATIVIEEELEGVKVVGNATKEITNISIDEKLMTDKEKLEDVMIAVVNNFFAKAVEKEGEETQNMMKDLLPPGFDEMFK
jgi:nucleoid-associated protein EbfC